jgi:small subunit ribosomal protein S13
MPRNITKANSTINNHYFKIISQNYLVDSELERVIQRDIKQLMSIGYYRGFRHNVGFPFEGL